MERERCANCMFERREGLEMERRTVAIRSSYMCCWMSFNGAMGRALRAQGVECVILVDVSGRRRLCVPTECAEGAHAPRRRPPWRIRWPGDGQGAGELGAEGKLWTEPGGYMGNAGPDETEREEGEAALRDGEG